jgi:hypothetical protein
MSAGAFIFARLNGSTAAANRVYPLLLPQQPTYPAVTYQQISSVASHAMGQDSPLTRLRVQVNSWGKTYAEARALATEVEARLKRFRGQAGSVTVLDVLRDNELETIEGDGLIRRIIQDYTVFIQQA